MHWDQSLTDYALSTGFNTGTLTSVQLWATLSEANWETNRTPDTFASEPAQTPDNKGYPSLPTSGKSCMSLTQSTAQVVLPQINFWYALTTADIKDPTRPADPVD